MVLYKVIYHQSNRNSIERWRHRHSIKDMAWVDACVCPRLFTAPMRDFHGDRARCAQFTPTRSNSALKPATKTARSFPI